jgi:hypothetical protein
MPEEKKHHECCHSHDGMTIWDWCKVVIMVLILTAIGCGVTINGKHYGVSGCDSTRGVIIDNAKDIKQEEDKNDAPK